MFAPLSSRNNITRDMMRTVHHRICALVYYCLLLLIRRSSIECVVDALAASPRCTGSTTQNNHSRVAILLDSNNAEHLQALENAGFQVIENTHAGNDNDDATVFATVYRFNRATGMLQRVSSSSSSSSSPPSSLSQSNNQPPPPQPPAWIPVDRPQENLLVDKGWAFLDIDDSEPQSSFDVDAANFEGTYQPKWGRPNPQQNDSFSITTTTESSWTLSSLGWDLTPLTQDEVKRAADECLSTELSRRVLLHGATDPPHTKRTNNGYELTGSACDIPPGIFTCALTGIPLFTTADLLATTASSGWLSFTDSTRLLYTGEHLQHVHPEPDSMDQRIEVVEAKSGCHLGHWFQGDSYCINASRLDFMPLGDTTSAKNYYFFRGPSSYRSYEKQARSQQERPSWRLLAEAVQLYKETTTFACIVLGGGCFWHVEAALRRLPGVVETTVGYAGGHTTQPTYEEVCSRGGEIPPCGHAEAVRVVWDPNILSVRQLVDCFLSLHDPTKVRAHGKHEPLVGQYRSCIFLDNDNDDDDGDSLAQMEIVKEAIRDCQASLGKEVCTQIATGIPFWPAEDRHQRYEERRNDRVTDTHTLSTVGWLDRYGRRAKSVIGTAHTLEESIAESRFYI